MWACCHLSQPKYGSGESDKRLEAGSEFVVTRSDSSKLHEFGEVTFNDITIAILVPVPNQQVSFPVSRNGMICHTVAGRALIDTVSRILPRVSVVSVFCV